MLKQFLAMSFLVAAAFAETAYFEVRDFSSNQFIIQLTNDERIKHARGLISGEITDEVHFMGRIKKTTASYNPKWSYYFDPNTISFFSNALEVCDATFSYTEDHLDEACGAFLPGCYLCNWQSKIVKEVQV